MTRILTQSRVEELSGENNLKRGGTEPELTYSKMNTIFRLEKMVPGFNKRKFRAYELAELAWRLGIGAFPDARQVYGKIYFRGKTRCIRYNPHLHVGDLGFVIGHEIGHFLFGHTIWDFFFEWDRCEKEADIAANIFRFPTPHLEQILKEEDDLTVELFFKHFGSCGMSEKFAWKKLTERIKMFFVFRKKHPDLIGTLGPTMLTT